MSTQRIPIVGRSQLDAAREAYLHYVAIEVGGAPLTERERRLVIEAFESDRPLVIAASDVRISRMPAPKRYRPYGYSAPVSAGGRCVECDRNDGSHARSCGAVS